MKRIIAVAMIILMVMSLCACVKIENKTDDSVQQDAIAEAEAAVKDEIKETEPATDASGESLGKTDNTTEPVSSSDIIHITCKMTNKGRSVGNDYAGGAYISYPEFELYDADEDRYPRLDDALDDLSDNYEREYKEHLNYSHNLGEEALADGSEMQIDFYDYLTPEVTRADDKILSIREYYESYTGGVHGYYAFYGDNFDPETGKKLILSDVVMDQDAFIKTVKEKLYAKYPEEPFDDLDTALADMFTTENGVMPWTMDYSGVTLYFNPYHIASYASGLMVITVPFNENQKLFVQDYMDIPDVYAEQLNEWAPVIADVNGDGMNEAVFVTEEIPEEMKHDGEDYGYRAWNVFCGGDVVTVSDYCYRAQYYLVHANDQYYVHIFEISDNDYSIFTSVDLKTMTNDKDKAFNACLSMLDSEYESDARGYESSYTEDVYTDPEGVFLSSRTEVLGSNTGTKLYYTGSDGWLASDDEYFDVYTSMVYTAKMNVECAEVDEYGKEISKATIKKGKYYHLVRTDGKTYADIQELDDDDVVVDYDYPYVYANEMEGMDSSETIYRLPYDCSEYPHTINGIIEDEVFDGILYAG